MDNEITDLYEEAEPFSVDMEELEQWASSRETSIEIAEAIHQLAHMCAWDPDTIWEDPSFQQFSAVMSHAWELADEGVLELHWGEETMVRGR